MLPTLAWADIELVAKIAPKNAGFTGMVDADQVLGGGGAGTLPIETIGVDSIDTSRLDDGSDTPVAGQCVKVATGEVEFSYEDCAGGTSVNLIGCGTCTTISGAYSTVFMAPGTCVDQVEAKVEQIVMNDAVLGDLRCISSGDPGSGKIITVTGRTGVCGSLASSGTFICQISGGSARPACSATTATMAVGSDDCWDLQVASSAALTTPVAINCTLERDS